MLAIPEPCHEDFSKMTPTQRGAFCGKCKIDTFDFRNLSDQAVNKLLLENKNEHLCGQFTTTQLASLNRGYLNWKNQKETTFRSKFVLALIVVFGLTLFSCDQESEKTLEELQRMELTKIDARSHFVNSLTSDDDTLNLIDFLEDEVEIIEPEEFLGEISVEGLVEFQPLNEVEIEDDFTRGKIEEPRRMLGGAMIATTYMEYLETRALEPIVQEEPKTVCTVTEPFVAKVYPNPTVDFANLALDIAVSGQFSIQLFDMNGRMVSQIYSGELLEGRQNFQLDLSDQPSGIYLVRLISNGQNETVKVQKLTQ